ncbi:hypothetical protein BDZ94DRAFT_1315466 [Collybia nuda]|uniref:Core-binding (CB) domain-containing protein n=1 Tax=Collybia nuda TaxID=64659 RepID=A0A9P5XSE6_9AGAR|nr:hypothetical protein BDZ94DRAFT_1315466 [Collybia nuda]
MLQRAAFYLWHGLASSTQKTYSSGQKSFIDFACLHPKFLDKPGKFLPATDQSIVEWICSLGDRGLQPKTIKTYLSTFTESSGVSNISLQPASSPGDLSSAFNASFDAAIKLAWASFLCCGEFTLNQGEKFNAVSNLTRSCVTFVPSIENPTHVYQF